MGYYADLEKLWKADRKKRERSFKRQPQSLRGPTLVGELLRLAAVTRDPRFEDAVSALKQHGIIDEHSRFNRHWSPSASAEAAPEAEELDRFLDLWNVLILHEIQGQSVRRACAQVAAGGVEAASFTAAVKRLQLQHAKLPQPSPSAGNNVWLIYAKAISTLLDTEPE
jgi:hypothetical protein